MSTVSNNLQIIEYATSAIKQSIIDKGGEISGNITTWASAIAGLASGGDNLFGFLDSNPKKADIISNKKNGELFGGEFHSFYTDPIEIEYIKYSSHFVTNWIAYPILNSENSATRFTVEYTPVAYMNSIYVSDESGTGAGDFRIDNLDDDRGESFFTIELSNDSGGDFVASTEPVLVLILFFDLSTDTFDYDYIYVQGCAAPCLVSGTQITMSDGSKKNVEDIGYDDELLVWDFDNGRLASAHPLWIKKPQIANYYYCIVFEDGSEFRCTGPRGHRMFNHSKQQFLYPEDCIGDKVYTDRGLLRVVSCGLEKCDIKFYNIITDHHLNLFADGILTSCRYNNLYPIQDMRFVKGDRVVNPFDRYNVSRKYYDGLRLAEQTLPIDSTNKYVERLVKLEQPDNY